jgi:RNA polymerase sigma-70 factor (ECF subfamily)
MDGALLESFRRGDRAALERVYSLYAREVEDRVRTVLIRLGRLTPADLADLVQEAFLRAFSDRARAQYDGRRDYGRFVIAIARNVVVDWSRRAGREVPLPDVVELFFEQAGDQVDPPPFEPALLANTEAYVAALPPDLQAVHRARFVLGMPQRQAAEAIGVSRQSLRTLEKKLLREFRRHLRRSEASKGTRPADRLAISPPTTPAPEGRLIVAQRR